MTGNKAPDAFKQIIRELVDDDAAVQRLNELQQQVKDGLITQSEADQLARRLRGRK